MKKIKIKLKRKYQIDSASFDEVMKVGLPYAESMKIAFLKGKLVSALAIINEVRMEIGKESELNTSLLLSIIKLEEAISQTTI